MLGGGSRGQWAAPCTAAGRTAGPCGEGQAQSPGGGGVRGVVLSPGPARLSSPGRRSSPHPSPGRLRSRDLEQGTPGAGPTFMPATGSERLSRYFPSFWGCVYSSTSLICGRGTVRRGGPGAKHRGPSAAGAPTVSWERARQRVQRGETPRSWDGGSSHCMGPLGLGSCGVPFGVVLRARPPERTVGHSRLCRVGRWEGRRPGQLGGSQHTRRTR